MVVCGGCGRDMGIVLSIGDDHVCMDCAIELGIVSPPVKKEKNKRGNEYVINKYSDVTKADYNVTTELNGTKRHLFGLIDETGIEE
jgi:hypothetical protein